MQRYVLEMADRWIKWIFEWNRWIKI